MSFLGARELEQVLNVDTDHKGWNVVFDNSNKYKIWRKWHHAATRDQFLYMKDFAEEHGFKFDELHDFNTVEGSMFIYIMTNANQTLLETLLSSRKGWG